MLILFLIGGLDHMDSLASLAKDRRPTQTSHAPGGADSQGFATILPSANTIRPSTIVVFTRPVRVLPCQGELVDLLKPAFVSYRHVSSGSNRQISAAYP